MEPRSQTLFFKEIYQAKPEPRKSGSNDSGFYKITRVVSVNSSTSTPPLAILIYHLRRIKKSLEVLRKFINLEFTAKTVLDHLNNYIFFYKEPPQGMGQWDRP